MPAWLRGLLWTLAALALTRFTGVQDGINRNVTDAHWHWRAQRSRAPFPSGILVVAVDDRSVAQLGRLRNWSRRRYAALLDRVRPASAVLLDIFFTEPDERDPAGDRALADAIRRNGHVVLPCYQWSEPPTLTPAVRERTAALLGRVPPPDARLAEALPEQQIVPETLEPPIAPVLGAAAGIGYADIVPDADGVFRAPWLLRPTVSGVPVPHAALATAAVAEGVPLGRVLSEAPDRLRLGDRTLPLPAGQLWLLPTGRRGGGFRSGDGAPVPTVSFVDALQARPAAFAGKVVLVGETMTGTSDIRPTPLDRTLRGVELNAEILASLLYLPPVRPLPDGVQWALVALAAGIPLWLYSRTAPRWATLGSLAALGLAVLVMEAGFWSANLVPHWAEVLVGSVAAMLSMGLYQLAREEEAKRHVSWQFSRYVSPRLVARYLRTPEAAREEGVRCRVTVFFSDVRSFTTYSEQNPPELVVRQMREYLDAMAHSVDVFTGTLDKYIGDAVMALFGTPLEGDTGNSAARAVGCALDMLERLEALNANWEAEGVPLFRIGIGVHTGDAIVGNIGTARREQYTALGDTVNLAARLQTATKELKAVLLVSEAARAEAEPLLAGRAEFLDRGMLEVRGRGEAVRVYEVRRVKPAAESALGAAEGAGEGG